MERLRNLAQYRFALLGVVALALMAISAGTFTLSRVSASGGSGSGACVAEDPAAEAAEDAADAANGEVDDGETDDDNECDDGETNDD